MEVLNKHGWKLLIAVGVVCLLVAGVMLFAQMTAAPQEESAIAVTEAPEEPTIESVADAPDGAESIDAAEVFSNGRRVEFPEI